MNKLSCVCIWQVATFNTSNSKSLSIITGGGVSLCGPYCTERYIKPGADEEAAVGIALVGGLLSRGPGP